MVVCCYIFKGFVNNVWIIFLIYLRWIRLFIRCESIIILVCEVFLCCRVVELFFLVLIGVFEIMGIEVFGVLSEVLW